MCSFDGVFINITEDQLNQHIGQQEEMNSVRQGKKNNSLRMTVGSMNKPSIKVQNSNDPVRRKQGISNVPIMVLNKN